MSASAAAVSACRDFDPRQVLTFFNHGMKAFKALGTKTRLSLTFAVASCIPALPFGGSRSVIFLHWAAVASPTYNANAHYGQATQSLCDSILIEGGMLRRAGLFSGRDLTQRCACAFCNTCCLGSLCYCKLLTWSSVLTGCATCWMPNCVGLLLLRLVISIPPLRLKNSTCSSYSDSHRVPAV